MLTTPKSKQPRGLVIVVHGDGPIDATYGGLYLPWFEAAADADYATLSWSKPGVGRSTGDWLTQTMSDRATETSAVIDWAKSNTGVPTDRIVLWGASQAGWVLPKVVASRTDISAVIAVSPAINWLQQGRYNLLAELDHNKVSTVEKEAAIARSNHTVALLKEGTPYDTYKSLTGDPEPMSRDRWKFVSLNYTSDAIADLKSMADQQIPIFLLLGNYDLNVDIKNTESSYKHLFRDKLIIKHFNAAHSMARPIFEDSQVAGALVGTLWPRALMATNVLNSYHDYLSRIP